MRRAVYQKILTRSLKDIDAICVKDAVRTCKIKSLFRDSDQPGTRMVFNICKAVGAFFPRAGYTQGSPQEA